MQRVHLAGATPTYSLQVIRTWQCQLIELCLSWRELKSRIWERRCFVFSVESTFRIFSRVLVHGIERWGKESLRPPTGGLYFYGPEKIRRSSGEPNLEIGIFTNKDVYESILKQIFFIFQGIIDVIARCLILDNSLFKCVRVPEPYTETD